jgi:hypothetical protein
MSHRFKPILLSLYAVFCLAACQPATPSPIATKTAVPTATAITGIDTPTSQPLTPSPEPDLVIRVDANQAGHAISPLIYGVSGASVDVLQSLRPTLNSWGGNPSTRYNWQIGHAWNAARDWYFRNGNYGVKEGSASDGFISDAAANGVEVRLAVPTLGWVAKDDNNNTCSFPTPDGDCSNVPDAKCDHQTVIADPKRANAPSTTASIQDWMRHLFVEQGFKVRFIAMDNEPELWGYTHYDVHPDCTTYQEILDKYLEYASAVRAVAPDAELTGPVTCCWYFYWNSAAGNADKRQHSGQDFLPWFLDQVRQHDQTTGQQSLNVLDIHYYPANLYNQNADQETAAHRLRSTRSLWDPSYVDESWIKQPVYLIPRMQALIDEHDPGLRLMISEWNWGADKYMNGALAIADVLGIFGRENLYAAAYWRFPPAGSPGFYAFKMYTNYDDQGSRFGGADGGRSIPAASDHSDWVTSYAATSTSGSQVYLMLVNKDPDQAAHAKVVLNGFSYQSQVDVYRYGNDNPKGIIHEQIQAQPEGLGINLPAYSITLLVLNRSG